METNIISQVAQKVFFKNTNVAKELQTTRDSNVVKDKLTLSKSAVDFIDSRSGSSDLEKNREIQVQRVKSLVQSGSYPFNKEVIDQIAEKIVQSLF
jgi:hypothetical protein